MINVIPTALAGVMMIQPRVFKDARGYFFESFSERDFKTQVLDLLEVYETAEGEHPFAGIGGLRFVQDNESMSTYGVMRGLHFQTMPYTQSKLVRCVKGAVLDVAVDIRKGSPTYGQHVTCLLCGSDYADALLQFKLMYETGFSVEEIAAAVNRQFFIARGFAHGFSVLSQEAVFQYKCDNFYASANDGGVSILDDSLGINWHIPTEQAILSEKDTKHALLRDFDSPFTFNSLYLNA